MLKRGISLFCCLAVALLIVSSSYAQQPSSQPSTPGGVLTNADILKMVEANLGDEMIIGKIKSSPGNFDTSIDAVLKLKAAGASDAVIHAMVEASPAFKAAAKEAPPALSAQQDGTKTLKIRDGTVVKLVLSEPLSSATSHPNDPVHFELAEDVKVGDTIALVKGAPAVGHVVSAQKKGGWGKSGTLEISIDYARAVDGNNVRLRATLGGGTKQAEIRPSMVLGVAGLLHRGKDVNVAKGTTMDTFVDGDREVTLPSTAK